ncbi:MAG: hypothetical protein KGM43_05535, partial [Planctomycetota bacterium]|nr:hypothetical protein [Planctomycetota bacterium]
MVKELSPFLDAQGRAYCYATSEDDGTGVVTDLDGEVTSALLGYRYYATYGEISSRPDVRQAVNLVRGELWHKRPPRQSHNPTWSATVEA